MDISTLYERYLEAVEMCASCCYDDYELELFLADLEETLGIEKGG